MGNGSDSSFSRDSAARLRVGFVELIDAAPLIVAAALGYYADEGLDVLLSRELGWGNVRDKLQFERLDAAHCVIGMPVRSALDDGPAAATRTIMALGSGGDAITLSKRLIAAGVTSGVALGRYVREGRRVGGNRLTLAHVSNESVHHYALRTWLDRAGLDPDRDVTLKVCPPPQVGRLMAAGHVDGFCSGEPWNLLAQDRGEGRVVGLTTDLFPAHPNKMLVANARWLARHRPAAIALVRAIRRGATFCAEPANAEPLAAILSRGEYLDIPADTILRSLRLDRRFGVPPEAGEVRPRDWAMRSFEAVRPDVERVAWFVGQMQRWGHADAALDARALAASTIDATVYDDATAAPPPDRGSAPPSALPHLDTSRKEVVPPTSPLSPPPSPQPSRRNVLRAIGAAGVAGAFASPLTSLFQGAAFAQEAPEVADVNFGIIALTDCSPIVIAHEKGFFKKYGINSTVTKGASWAAIRDSLANGQIQATHMLLGMPLASTMGLGGQPKKPMVIPWLMNRNGQCISVKSEWKGKVTADPKTVKPFVDAAKAAGTPLSFAVTFPPGTHAMWMRYWLAAGGVNPDKDVSLVVVPPAQMVANMKVGKMDGFCVGEPWNAKAIADGIGYTAISTQGIWKDHPEKVCAFTAEFAEQNPKTVKAVLKALNEASVWLDEMSNRAEACKLVGLPTYINCPPGLILGRLMGNYDYGDGRKEKDPNYMIFSQRNCNYPQAKYAKWFLSQFERWGMNTSPIDYDAVAKQVMRGDLYEEAMKELGHAHAGADESPETFFDGKVFDPSKPSEYAKSFEIKA